MLTAISNLAGFLEEGGLEADWRGALGLNVLAAVTQAPLSVDLLQPGELARYRLLGGPERRRSWLTGRAALKRLLRRLDLGPDTSRLEFPVADISLSHSGSMALAVACRSALEGPAARGLGVDLEPERSMNPKAARFFLAPEEWERMRGNGDGSGKAAEGERALLRAWTVKEAVFKADPGNRGRMLHDYRLDDPSAARGAATLDAEGVTYRFRYRSHCLAGWHISLAAQSGNPHG